MRKGRKKVRTQERAGRKREEKGRRKAAVRGDRRNKTKIRVCLFLP